MPLITRLTTKVREAVASKDDLGNTDLSIKLKEKLESDFRNHHFAIIELLEEESDLEHEQTILDQLQHDDEVLDLTTWLDLLVNISPRPQSSTLSVTKTTGRRLEHLCKSFTKVSDAVGELTELDDVFFIRLHGKQLSKFKCELEDISKSILNSDEAEDEALSHQQTEIEQQLFSCSLTVKRLLESRNHSTTSPLSSSHEGVKLPKLEVPSFDGSILNWKTFWDKFYISVHLIRFRETCLPLTISERWSS